MDFEKKTGHWLDICNEGHFEETASHGKGWNSWQHETSLVPSSLNKTICNHRSEVGKIVRIQKLLVKKLPIRDKYIKYIKDTSILTTLTS